MNPPLVAPMAPLEEARALMLAALAPVGAERVSLAAAAGRTLAAPVMSTRDQPPIAVSAMDGYALRSADLADLPARLSVVGESAAGRPWTGALPEGAAVAIATGAAVPDGADQVVPREDAVTDEEAVTLDARPTPGRHIRPAGSDFASGAAVLGAGALVTPAALALAAAAGATWLSVRRTPSVALIASGDELVEPGEPAGPHQIINANVLGLGALVTQAGGAPRSVGIARDTPEAMRAAYDAAEGADLVVVVGGASVGEHDHARRVFGEAGTLIFERIAVKPGKPTWFGRRASQAGQSQAFLGLPGNPVSSLVIGRLMLVPALAALLGRPAPERLATIDAALAEPLPANGSREAYLRAVVETDAAGTRRARILAGQESHRLHALAEATALLPRAIGAPALAAGAVVPLLPL